MNPIEKRKAVQSLLGVTPDGVLGPNTRKAFEALAVESYETHEVIATSFADPEDVRAFRKCKAQGKSDQECFKVGDNGIGFTGMDCSTHKKNLCALPTEDWKPKWGTKGVAAGKAVAVMYHGKEIIGHLGDTMPKRANIKNGSGIELNPGFAKSFGLTPPILTKVSWRWA